MAGPLRDPDRRRPGRALVGLDGHWSDWFGGLQVTNERDETILSGTLADLSALHGVLNHVGGLGLAVIAVRRLPPEDNSGKPR